MNTALLKLTRAPQRVMYRVVELTADNRVLAVFDGCPGMLGPLLCGNARRAPYIGLGPFPSGEVRAKVRIQVLR